MEFDLKDMLDNKVAGVTDAIVGLIDTLKLEGMVTNHCVYDVKKTGKEILVSRYLAPESAINALADINCKDPNNTKEAVIYPGIIQLSPTMAAEYKVIDKIKALNNAKRDLKSWLKEQEATIKPKRVKTENGVVVKVNAILFEHFPMLNTSQLFRDVHFLDEPVAGVNLQWRVKRRYVTYKKEAAHGYALNKGNEAPPLDMSRRKWQSSIDMGIELLEALPEESEVVRIPFTPPTPQLQYRRTGEKQWRPHHNAIPLILLGNETIIKDVTLKSVSVAELQKNDPEQLGWSPLCKVLDFYYPKN